MPLLVEQFLRDIAPSLGRETPKVSDDAMACLSGYRWPGNIRELRNIIKRGACWRQSSSSPSTCRPRSRPVFPNGAGVDAAGSPAGSQLEEHERLMIVEALDASKWNCSAAARGLGISRDVLGYRMKKHRLQAPLSCS